MSPHLKALIDRLQGLAEWLDDVTGGMAVWAVPQELPSSTVTRAIEMIRTMDEQIELMQLHWKSCMRCHLTWEDPTNEIPCPRCSKKVIPGSEK